MNIFKKHLLLLFCLISLSYFLSSGGDTPYNYFTRLAGAFLEGKYWLTQNPPWLNELVPVGNIFYVVYPPLPAILATPFVFIFGINFPQQYLAHLVGAAVVVTIFLISLKIKKDAKLAVWSSLLAGFGTIIWYMSANGSVWLLGQTTALLFLLVSLLLALDGKGGIWVGFFIGLAYLARPHTILGLPLFIYLLRKDFKEPINVIKFILPLIAIIAIDFLYNYLRFGVFWNKGYALIPGVLTEPWYANGLVHPSYIARNLRLALFSLPKILDKVPFVEPSWSGLAIWFTTPAFILTLRASIKDKANLFAWLSAALVLTFVLMHGSPGFSQFGYRYAVDAYPFLLFLTIKSAAQSKLSWYHWLLLAAGILVNLWGVVWINKFGWASY